MTIDLRYLVYTAMLTAALWIPYIVCQVKTNGPLEPKNYVDPTARPVPPWGQRAHRAYLNAVEVFAPFAALVIVAQLAGKANSVTAFWAIASSGFGWRMRLCIGPPFPICAQFCSPWRLSPRREFSGNHQVIPGLDYFLESRFPARRAAFLAVIPGTNAVRSPVRCSPSFGEPRRMLFSVVLCGHPSRRGQAAAPQDDGSFHVALVDAIQLGQPFRFRDIVHGVGIEERIERLCRPGHGG